MTLSLPELKLHAAGLLPDEIYLNNPLEPWVGGPVQTFHWQDTMETVTDRDWHFIAHLLEKKLTENQFTDYLVKLVRGQNAYTSGPWEYEEDEIRIAMNSDADFRIEALLRVLQPNLFTSD